MANEKTDRLLAQRNSTRKPAFVVKETAFKANVKPRWRKPTGKHSPVRQYHKGRVKMPHVGYGAPKAVKGLTRDGFNPVLVFRDEDLESVDSNKDVVVIASNVGTRKRLGLLNICLEKGFNVYSVKDVNQKIESYNKEFSSRKELRSANKAKQSQKKATKNSDDKKAEDKKTEDKKAEDKNTNEADTKKSETKEAKTDAVKANTESKN